MCQKGPKGQQRVCHKAHKGPQRVYHKGLEGLQRRIGATHWKKYIGPIDSICESLLVPKLTPQNESIWLNE